MFRQYLVPILVLLFLLIDHVISIHLVTHSPRNNTKFLDTLLYRFEISSDDIGFIDTLSVQVNLNEKIIFSSSINRLCYELIFENSFFPFGDSVLHTQLINETEKIIYDKESITVTRLEFSTDYLNSILSMSKSNQPTALYSYALINIGYSKNFSHDLLSRFIGLNPKRVEVFITDTFSITNDSYQTPIISFESKQRIHECQSLFMNTKIVHCFNSLSSLHYLSFVDITYVIIHPTIFTDTSSNINTITLSDVFNMTIWSTIKHISRRQLWLLIPLHTSHTYDAILAFHGFEVVQFHTSLDGPKTKEVYPGYEIWMNTNYLKEYIHIHIPQISTIVPSINTSADTVVNDTTIITTTTTNSQSASIELPIPLSLSSTFTSSTQSYTQENIQKSSIERSYFSTWNDQDFHSNKRSSLYSDILMDNYDVSRSFILLSNVCMSYDNPKLIFLFKASQNASSIMNMTFLASQEDYGFQYTGYMFQELYPNHINSTDTTADTSTTNTVSNITTISSISPDPITLLYDEIMSSWSRVPGMTALSIAVTPHHIVHETEPIVQLLYMSTLFQYYTDIHVHVHDVDNSHMNNTNHDSCQEYDHNIGQISNNNSCHNSSNTDNIDLYTLLYMMVDSVLYPHELTSFMRTYSMKTLTLTLTQKYQYIMIYMRRIIFNTLTEAYTSDWLYTVIGLIMTSIKDSLYTICNSYQDHVYKIFQSRLINELKYDKTHIHRYETLVDTITRENICDNISKGPAVYLHDHLSDLSKQYDNHRTGDSKNHGICYDQLLLFGRSNSHISFYGNTHIASTFRQTVYNYINNLLGDEIIPNEYTDLPESLLVLRHKKIKVTVVLRGGSTRLLYNQDKMIQLLRNTDFVDIDWLNTHIITFDLLSFEKQIRMMSETDVFITIHGAAIINSIFMRSHSVTINLLNGPFIEYVFQPPLKEADIKLIHIPILNSTTQCPGCNMSSAPTYCLSADIVDGGRIECIALRSCSFYVNIPLFRASLYEAYYHILSTKWASALLNKH